MSFCVKEDFDCQLLYFTSSSCRKSGKGLVFIGEKDGNPNVYRKDFATDKITQLSDNHDGTMKTYVYFNGNPRRGLSKASVCLDNERELVYYLQGQDVCQADMQGNIRVLNRIPDDQVTAFMHTSADGTRLCVPTTDWRALDDPPRGRPIGQRPDYDIDERVQKEKLNSYLRVFDTATGEEILCEKVPLCWITHVQFHPKNNDIIMYNHEWPSHCGLRRIWIWNGKYHRAVRTMDEGRSINDWACHEMWSEDGSEVIYHGGYYEGNYYVGRFVVETGELKEIALPEDYTAYGHFTISKDGLLVSDGYYQPENDTSVQKEGTHSKAAWITVQKIDWEKGTMQWFPLEQHNSSWLTQDAHPHPIYDPTGKTIWYTSDKSGKLEVYSVPVPEEAFK